MNNTGLPTRILPVCTGAFLGLAAGAAPAQSNVGISGYLDIGVHRDIKKAWNVGPIQPNNIAFTGTEDLGGGLAATFRLSHRFDPDTGGIEPTNKPFWHGESTLGLKGSFGSLQFGRRLDAIYANDWAFDPWYNFDRVASPAWDLWHFNFPSDPKGNNGTAEFGRLNNGIFYDSPAISGFSLHLSGSPETSAGDASKPYAAAVQYKNDLLRAMVAHGTNSAGNTEAFIGLNASFSKLGLMGVYDVTKAGSSKAKSTTLGGTCTMGPYTFRAGWGQVDLDGVKAEKVYAAGGIYALSKRTSVYVDFAHKVFPTQSANTYGVGMAHSF